MTHTPASASLAQVPVRRLAVRLVPALLVASIVLPVPAGAMTLDEYRDALGEVSDLTSSVQSMNPETAESMADAIEEALPDGETVDLGGAEVPVRDRRLMRLVKELRDADTAGEIRQVAQGIDERTGALLGALGEEGAEIPADAAALEEILARNKDEEGTSLGEWLSEASRKFAEWVAEMLSRLFGGLSGTDISAPDLSGAWPYFLGASAALAAGLLVYLAVRLVRWWRRRAAKTPADEGDPVIAAAEDLPPDALGYAERLAAAGRFREAVRALFGGAARALVERGVIARAKTRTNGELLSDVRATAPALVGDLGSLAAIFERAWYGRRDPGADGVERARGHYRAVMDATAQSGGHEA